MVRPVLILIFDFADAFLVEMAVVLILLIAHTDDYDNIRFALL